MSEVCGKAKDTGRSGFNKKRWHSLCCQRQHKYVLSAFNDYFILTGEFISGLHYRGLAAPRRPSIYALRFTEGVVKIVRSPA